MLVAALVWAALIVLYVAKWFFARSEAAAELDHPIQCCFVGLIGVSTSLISLATQPYSAALAGALFFTGALSTLAFALWRTGLLLRGERDASATTPVLYLPLVAGAFVSATAAAGLGYTDWGQLAFGAGLFSWLAIESVLLHRLYTAAPLPPALRPTLGIQLAPPTVGAVAYLSVSAGPPEMLVHMLIGYGVLQGMLLVRMLPWILQQPFVPSYWAFTFGATALATAPLRMVELGAAGAVATLTPYLFAAANLTVALVAFGSLRLLRRSWLDTSQIRSLGLTRSRKAEMVSCAWSRLSRGAPPLCSPRPKGMHQAFKLTALQLRASPLGCRGPDPDDGGRSHRRQRALTLRGRLTGRRRSDQHPSGEGSEPLADPCSAADLRFPQADKPWAAADPPRSLERARTTSAVSPRVGSHGHDRSPPPMWVVTANSAQMT
jgi:tellurite resistance protein